MIPWSIRHQFFYIVGAFAVIVFIIILPTLFKSYQPPTCTDGIKNQGELGIDCGGPCSLLCKRTGTLDLIIHWQRAFKVKDGVYNALAYIENPNLDYGIKEMSYRFKLYDSENVLIYERDGQTPVAPNKIFGIFEGDIQTGSRVPARTLFEFMGAPVWVKNFAKDPPLVISSKLLSDQDTSPRLTASVQNPSASPVYNAEVSAILYDETGNAIAASRTVVDAINPTSSAPLVFTWPQPFGSPPTRIELFYRVVR